MSANPPQLWYVNKGTELLEKKILLYRNVIVYILCNDHLIFKSNNADHPFKLKLIKNECVPPQKKKKPNKKKTRQTPQADFTMLPLVLQVLVNNAISRQCPHRKPM